MKLNGEVAVVTGGSEGIGFGIARLFASEGAKVAIISRNPDKLNKAADLIKAVSEQSVLPIQADVAKAEDVQAAIGQIQSIYGKIDILVNSAGIITKELKPVQEVDVPEWTKVIETNLWGTFLFCRAIVPIMKVRNHGYIINILTTGAFRTLPGNSTYSASKYGARAITEALIEENRGSGIRITSVSPGPVDTPIWDYKAEKATADERSKMLQIDDIANIALFLVTQPSRAHIDNITVRPWYF